MVDDVAARDFNVLGVDPPVIVRQKAGDNATDLFGFADTGERGLAREYRLELVVQATTQFGVDAPGAIEFALIPRSPNSLAM